MLILPITFIVSLGGMIAIVSLKMSVFRDRHFGVWLKVRQYSDRQIHAWSLRARKLASRLKHKSLLHLVSVAYHKIIPFVERQYRAVASSFYKLHRKLWSILEYSKSSTKNVSEHLKQLSDDKTDH